MRVFCTFCLQHQSQTSNCLHYIQNYLSIFQTFLLPLLQIFGKGYGGNTFCKKGFPRNYLLIIPYSSTSAKQLPPMNSLRSELQGTHLSSISLKYLRNLIKRFAVM